ncbi:glycoside hydrolase family 3 N-terminal domain-containing protein [Haloarcula japonica]|uniref:beta-glucosidase n=1 Tax=Haloarcula japonica (strain ATCC 49778 / DSM 6131 / JCM 7785 / NBRC 101032 / NCIMB 13157 / TR-1) TaxID=1227453 RepID=M0L9S0_HALJT|nr:glycoside hydrolase family 3 N-terminal domain-containing protein [Haloarcula japonica]EMA29838.1 beta-glucosidase [Haloarcula japonica DSM 6131]
MARDTTDDGMRASRRTFLKATGVATAAAATGAGVGTAAAQPDVDSLIDDLTLEQKAAQMTQVAISSFEAEPEKSNVPDSFGVDTVGEYFSELGVGSILSGGAEPPSFDGETVVQGINALQEYNLANADHDIPFLYGVDATHGNGLLEGATVFPQRLNMGATRDLSLIEAAERHTSDSTASMGAHWTFAPTTDLQRDPRWGRFFEGISEDPKLEADVSRVRARALEDDDRLTACVKHFAAYSVPNNGNDRAPASTSLRDLRTNILPPYREALESEPGTVMVNSGSINGVPAHASHWLLTTLLRDTYGYEGMVVSDWDDLNRMITNHDYAPDFETATEMAINAGVDMYMIGNGGDAPGPVQFIDTVVGLVEDGAIPMARIDEAVRRILELKADLGLFEQPTVDESRIGNVLGGAQETSETMAKESLVLLKNTEDALPLSGDETVLLTGPGVDSDGNNTRALMQHGGWTLGWQGASAGGPYPRQNLLEDELGARVGSLTHVPTAYENTTWYAGEGDGENQQSDENGNFDFTDEQRSQVESAAPESDAVVVVIGEGTHNEGFGDRDELVLDESQQALLDTVVESADDSTPIIGVMLAGAPRGSPETFSQLDALLFAGQPGSDGGIAIAETLVGEHNPSGKLPFSWPENVGTAPVQHNRYDPTSTGGTDNTAIFEYGHGLSYTDFQYGSVSVTQPTVGNPANQSEVTVSVEVTNTGGMAGEHIVEVFNTQSYGSVLQPMRRLLGYERVSLDAGESTTVDVTADLTALEVVPGDVLGLGPKVVEAGEYELTVGQDGPTATLIVQNAASITDPDPVPGLPNGTGSNPGRGNSGNGTGNGNNGNGNNTSRDPTMEDVVDLLNEVRRQS